MTFRDLRDDDIPKIRAMYEEMGFGYAFPDLRGPMVESVRVGVDENDNPLVAVCAERICQLYFFADSSLTPLVTQAAIRGLHSDMVPIICSKGYDGVEAFLPHSVSGRFGRWLSRRFGWSKNWESWGLRWRTEANNGGPRK